MITHDQPGASPPGGNGRTSSRTEQHSQAGGNGASRPRLVSRGDVQLAQALGWLSLGLGVAGVGMPGQVARLIGLKEESRNLEVLRLIGVREVVSGLGILSDTRPAGWLWSRVAGDMMDLALLGGQLARADGEKPRLAAATAVIAGVTAVDVIASRNLAQGVHGETLVMEDDAAVMPKATEVHCSVTIGKSADELYALWRRPETLPRIMSHFADVTVVDAEQSHWRLRAPMGQALEWDDRLVEDVPSELLRWESAPGAAIPNRGSVRFTPALGDWGTVVTLHFRFDPPGGKLAEPLLKLLRGIPRTLASKALGRFKALAETGEIPTTQDQPAARADRD